MEKIIMNMVVKNEIVKVEFTVLNRDGNYLFLESNDQPQLRGFYSNEFISNNKA
jgi:hypothetical protein